MLTAEFLTQIYGERTVLKDFSFSFTANQIYGIIGPNGAGKSTLLRLLTAVEKPSYGRVFFDNQPLDHPIPEIGCVWQRPYLFQTSVSKNIAYGLKLRHWKEGDCRARVARLLSLFHLENLKDAWAPELSVGESARVAIARAIAPFPRLLILDEPTANLDPGQTLLVEEILTFVQKEAKIAVIIVTHDMFQAKRIADTTLFLRNGTLEESGPSGQLFAAPASGNTRRFIEGELV
ncbi:MAG: ATP-binding cassette domain-containing protein [Bacillota bacterium]